MVAKAGTALGCQEPGAPLGQLALPFHPYYQEAGSETYQLPVMEAVAYLLHHSGNIFSDAFSTES